MYVLAGSAAFAPVDQHYLLQARQMQALSFAVHIPLVAFGISFPAMVLLVEWLGHRRVSDRIRIVRLLRDRGPRAGRASSFPGATAMIDTGSREGVHKHRMLAGRRAHKWTGPERAVLIMVVAVVMGSLFVTTYSLALGNPVPRHVPMGLVESRTADPLAITATEKITGGKAEFHHYSSESAAMSAINGQSVYAVLDVSSSRPTLHISSAAGASVARVLDRIDGVDPAVRVIDAHPLASNDPSGLDIFYLMLVATLVGMITVFQVRSQAPGLELRHHISFVVGLAVLASTVLTLVDGPLLHRPAALYPEEWAILAAHVLTVASFASLMALLLGPWAIVPSWLFFVILGNASSGGAVSPALLPEPFAALSQWLPSGATVSALRNAIYFRHYQLARPLLVLGLWGAGLFATWVLTARHRESPPLRGAASG